MVHGESAAEMGRHRKLWLSHFLATVEGRFLEISLADNRRGENAGMIFLQRAYTSPLLRPSMRGILNLPDGIKKRRYKKGFEDDVVMGQTDRTIVSLALSMKLNRKHLQGCSRTMNNQYLRKTPRRGLLEERRWHIASRGVSSTSNTVRSRRRG